MTGEQNLVVDNFRKNFINSKDIIIYGTGVNAYAVVSSCVKLDIIGVMDSAKTGETFCNLPVMSLEEVIKSGSKCIVIVARPSVYQIIYRRIKKLVNENGIFVYDVYGNIIEEKSGEVAHPYFERNFDELLKKIDEHQVISFDIFDTLITRCVSNPTDVFEIMNMRVKSINDMFMKKNDGFNVLDYNRFAKIRCEVEKDICEKNPTIEDIYMEIGKKYGLKKDYIEKLIQCEIETEISVLRIRKQMNYCMEYAIKTGKKVILVSDMYLGRKWLQNMLGNLGIAGYERLYVSCDYKATKMSGLWDIVKRDYNTESILHIGDNEDGDYKKPMDIGIHAYHILSPMKMLELSSHKNILSHVRNISEKIFAGMVAANLFNDPFALYNSKGKARITCEKAFVYIYIAPTIVSFVVWLMNQIKDKDGIMLFSSRDGYLIQKLYRFMRDKYKLSNLPGDEYFLISRKAALDALSHKETDNLRYKNYKKYLDKLNLKAYKNIYLFDFMSKGTCQYALEKILERDIQGLYFQKSNNKYDENGQMKVSAFYKESSAFEADRYLFAMCDFLECILSSDMPSLHEMDDDGKPVYAEDIRTESQIKQMMSMHNSILEYAKDISDILDISELDGHVDFLDELLRCTDIENAVIDIEGFENIILDVSEDEVKNTGYDLFVGGRKSGS